MVTCNVNATTQRWKMRNIMVRGWGGLYLHLEGGNANGGVVTARRCNGTLNQRWTFWYEIGSGLGCLRLNDGSNGRCLQLGSTNGTQATVTSCAPTSSQNFRFDAATGQIRRTGTGVNKCLDIEAILIAA